MSKKIESQISKSIENYLTAKGFYNLRLNSGKIQTVHKSWIQLCPKGTPDRFAIVNGKPVFIEVKKSEKETPSPEQLETHEILRGAGAIVIVAVSVDDVISAIEQI